MSGAGRDTSAEAAVDAADLVKLAADIILELDAEHRFTLVRELADSVPAAASSRWLGKRPWETDLLPVGEGGWSALRSALEERRAVRAFHVRHTLDDDRDRHLEFSATPLPDGSGYRGIARDISSWQDSMQELEYLEAILDASPDLIFAVDPVAMRLLYVNQTACNVSGYSREELLALHPADINTVSRDELAETYEEVLRAGDEGVLQETIGIGKDGSRGWFESRRRRLLLDGRPIIVTISRDTTERRLAEDTANRMRQMYAALVMTNEAILYARSHEDLFRRVCASTVASGEVTDAVVLWSEAPGQPLMVVATESTRARGLPEVGTEFDAESEQLPGLVREALRTREAVVAADLGGGGDTRPWHDLAERSKLRGAAVVPFGLATPASASGALMMFSPRRRTFDGATVELLERVAANLGFALENFRLDLQRREAQARIEHLATHDPLTNLPNRRMFSELLSHAIETSNRHDRPLALLFVDLDGFKGINDTLGHDAGDEVLVTIADRFDAALRASDVIARIGGDEFVGLLQEVHDRPLIETIATRLVEAARTPVMAAGEHCRIGASVGIAVYPDDARDGPGLIAAADRAMYLAKRLGKNRFHFHADVDS